ncbi:putative cadherin-like protein 26 [Scophthalmus maximus]|uniref:Putative cadherin-like protein 26 n=1 Tax=Scophthalmus maximus TaxID=52904 RepID=A0A2U9BH19_SCOMX|nr:putative cadherin-like protein 26 [Scophthalmus maximus]
MLRFYLLVYYLSCTTCSELLKRHTRSWIIDSFTIEEGHTGPFPYVLGTININRDYRIYFDLYGEGVDKEPKGVLSIQKETGTVYVHRAVDYEEKTKLQLKFEARRQDLSIDTRLGVEVAILDINDNPPLFQRDQFELSVDEEKTQGSPLLTVVAYDRDQRGTPNSSFHYEIKSVSPNSPDTEFFIEESGAISFKGCLDHELAERIVILVEAKDHGEVVSLSSSTTVVMHVQDSNDHMPTISGQTGTSKVKEETTGSSPLRLHVTDGDTPSSPAWRARYTIHGDEGGHFAIETDPDSNDGILTVVKPLNFEKGAQRELSISVENELPYFSCQPHSVKVVINVEDANEAPVFSVTYKIAALEENSPSGTWVEKVTAVDADCNRTSSFVYKVAHDPAGWVMVDPNTGDITTVTSTDRESPHVVNGVYTVLIHAVDDGVPPLTGTATLQIHMTDKNDNVPQPAEHNLDVCVSDGPTTTNITAFDLDGNPYGGPFTFELLGDVKGKWKLSPSHGYTAGLVKEPSVYAGPHTIDLKISDMQGEFGIYNLRVAVCDCSVTENCRARRNTTTRAAYGGIGVVFALVFLLLFLLLMAVTCSCKKDFVALETTGHSSGQTLLESNTENPGTDCKVFDGIPAAITDEKYQDPSKWQSEHSGIRRTNVSTKGMNQTLEDRRWSKADYRRGHQSHLLTNNYNQTTWNSVTANGHHQTHQDMGTMNFHKRRSSSYTLDETLLTLIHRGLSTLQETGDDLLDYQPHLYGDEGDADNLSDLDNISIPGDESYEKTIEDLGPRFTKLASICKPPQTQN